MSRYFSAAMAPSTPLPPGWNDPYYGTNNSDGTSVDLSMIGAGFLNGGTDGATKPPMDDKTKAMLGGVLLLLGGILVYGYMAPPRYKSRRSQSRRSRLSRGRR